MKNLFKLVLLLLSAGILITSCKTASLTKRHYNKGYYVSHSGKKAKPPVHTSDEKLSVAKVESLSPKTTALPLTSAEQPLMASNYIPQRTASAKQPAETKKVESKLRYAGTENEISIKELVKNPFKITKVVTASDSDKDALSLIWILIVVLLIVYIAGLLLDNFGLGGIIHILGVIILVLLILWLLKII